jgi:hypothetical protein
MCCKVRAELKLCFQLSRNDHAYPCFGANRMHGRSKDYRKRGRQPTSTPTSWFMRLVLAYRDSLEQPAPALSVRPRDGTDKATTSLGRTLLAKALLEIASVIQVQSWTRRHARRASSAEGRLVWAFCITDGNYEQVRQ